MLNNKKDRKQNFGLIPISIAHDLNNLLTALLFNAEMLSQQTELSEYSRQRIEEILVSAHKASQLNQQTLLTHVNQANFRTREAVDLNDLVKEARPVMNVLAGETTLEFEYADVELPIYEIRLNIEQILMNLIANATTASNDETSIQIRTGFEELEYGDRNHHDLIGERTSGGRFCYFEVEDHGCGLTEEYLKRIFEPGISKEIGKGQGIGLAVVINFVNEFEGFIRVSSSLGNGTKFRILIPTT